MKNIALALLALAGAIVASPGSAQVPPAPPTENQIHTDIDTKLQSAKIPPITAKDVRDILFEINNAIYLNASGYVASSSVNTGAPSLGTPTLQQVAANCLTNVCTYYIATNGNDANDGLSPGTAWRTPNHSLNCSANGGDTVLVQPGTYASRSFHLGHWGAPGTGCTSGTFRTLKCGGSTLHSCIVDDAGSPGSGSILVDSPYWIIQGFEATSNVNSGAGCFGPFFGPKFNPAWQGHHIVFINNYARDCYRGSGLGDYSAFIGFISYHSAYANNDSGISAYELQQFDTAPGTHLFLAGGFIFKAQNPPNSTDGEGFIFDDWDHRQSNHIAYTGRGVIEQSMFIGNGSDGVEAFQSWLSSHYLLSSTLWGNAQDTQSGSNALGEVYTDQSSLQIDHVIMQSTKATNTHFGGATYNVYALVCGYCSGTVTNTDYFGVSGHHYFGSKHNETDAHHPNGYDYTFGAGNVSVDPQFVSPAIPASAPDCSTSSTVIQCMSTVIANFRTTNGAVAAMGYHSPSSCAPDPYWPTWIPVSVVPDGLVSKPCS
jgi:hypothetical protein